ncbi:MAG: cytochrome c oxidase assembly protein subunit 11 [Flavobacterium sp.]|jgi:cytochrome c oxidase assembly protein subunit 11
MSEAKPDLNIKRTTIKLLSVTVGMFAFGFALVPLYDAICEVTGLNGKTSGKYVSDQEERVVENRTVKIQFLTTNNANMPWDFRPETRSIEVQPGKLNATSFFVRNPANNTITAQAIPSVTPFRAAQYLHKTECFCFGQQELASGESLEMPLRFIIDADLPKEINTLTLSYTLYDITEQVNGSLAKN